MPSVQGSHRRLCKGWQQAGRALAAALPPGYLANLWVRQPLGMKKPAHGAPAFAGQGGDQASLPWHCL